MQTNSNKCPVCKTEYSNPNQKEIAEKILNKYKINYSKIEQENHNLKTEIEALNQKIEELQEKLKSHNIQDSEDQYNNLADNLEIQELIDKLNNPLVVEVIKNIFFGEIKNIVNNYVQQPNNQVIPENQDDLKLNQFAENINDENIDETKTDEVENQLQEDNLTESAINLTPLEQALVNQYKNFDPDFKQSMIKVSESEETQENRRGGRKENTIFQKNHLGNYWIYPSGESSYIFPPQKLTINEFNQETVESVFESQGYNHSQSNNFTLIKPGKVNAITSDKWEVVERGILKF